MKPSNKNKTKIQSNGKSDPAAEGGLLSWDKRCSKRMALCSNEKSPLGSLRPLMRALEYSCHGVPWLVCTIAGIIASHDLELQVKLINLLLALIADLIVIGSCKALFRRQRPLTNKNDMMTILMDKYSFPSGHTTRAALLACFIPSHFEIGLVATGLIVLWAFCVSLSRILLGRHHITDVVCGVVIGLAVFVMVERVLWMSPEQCMAVIRPIQEEIHL